MHALWPHWSRNWWKPELCPYQDGGETEKWKDRVDGGDPCWEFAEI